MANSKVNKKKSDGTFGLIVGIIGLVSFISMCQKESSKSDKDTTYPVIDYIDESNPNANMGADSDSVSNAADDFDDYYDIVLTTSSLNFRREPNIQSDIICTFSKDFELEVIGKKNNGWLLVEYDGDLGYVYENYTVSLLDKAMQEYPWLNLSGLNIKKIVYSSTDLNVRDGDGNDYIVKNKLSKYESVRVLEQYGQWYFVMTNDYNFGFINKDYVQSLMGTFVVVDISEQQLYMYKNGELYFMTPVTTGKDSTPTDIGLFKIYSKEKDRYLSGEDYRAHVDYWIPYNGGEGLHDADWHNFFGTDNYKSYGSHGCVNLPPNIAPDIYETVSVGTKVLVHK